ncbi:MAG: hypothetical protein ABI672_08230 [Vicinamibacteria bacterium]
MKVWRTYRALDPEQQNILAKKAVDLRRTPDELIKLLAPIAAYDAAIGEHVNSAKLGCTGAFATFAAIGIFFVGLSGWTPLVALLLVVTAFVSVAVWTLWWKLHKADLSDNLRETALPVLRLLRDDFARGEPIHLRLDLRQPTDAAKKTGKSKPYKRGAYYSIIDTDYEDPWMTLKANLNDGSLLLVRAIDSVTVMNRTKRGSSGKTRTNTRQKKKSRVNVHLGVRRKDFLVVKPPTDGRVKTTDKREVIALSRRARMKDLTPISPLMIIDAIADAYRSVRPNSQEAGA